MTPKVTTQVPVTASRQPDGAMHSVPERRLYRVAEAMQLLSMSRTVFYEQVRSGRLRSVKLGRTRLIPAEAITEFVESLIAESKESNYDRAA